MKIDFDVVGVVSDSDIESIIASTKIRRAGIPCEKFFTRNIKKQMKKSSNLGAVVIITNGKYAIKDMITGNQKDLDGDLVEAIRDVLENGYYE